LTEKGTEMMEGQRGTKSQIRDKKSKENARSNQHAPSKINCGVLMI
jgi:hypothetical protein